MRIILQGRALIPGQARGAVLVSNEPLSFWGGYDYQTGTIIDQRHPLAGQCAAHRILALTTAPDSFFALASIVADEMYGRPIPLCVLSGEDFAQLQMGQPARVYEDGRVEISKVSRFEP